MNIYKLVVHLEIGVTEDIKKEYQEEIELEKRIHQEIQEFVKNIKDFDGYKVGYAEASSYHLTSINEFRVHPHSHEPKNEKYHIYLYTGAELYLLSDEKLTGEEFFPNIYWFKKEGLPIMVNIYSFNDREELKRDKKIELVQITNVESKEIPV